MLSISSSGTLSNSWRDRTVCFPTVCLEDTKMRLILPQCRYCNTYKHSIGTSTTSVGRNVPFWRSLPPIPVLIFYLKMYSRVKSGRSHTFMLKWMLTNGFLQWSVRALIFTGRQRRPSTPPHYRKLFAHNFTSPGNASIRNRHIISHASNVTKTKFCNCRSSFWRSVKKVVKNIAILSKFQM